MLNLGQGVAWDLWHGRGARTNHPENYPEYSKGGDNISFDIYPVVHDKPEVRENLWYVPKSVDRLREWTGRKKLIWNCIKCTHIGNEKALPTPAQVRAEVWMSSVASSGTWTAVRSPDRRNRASFRASLGSVFTRLPACTGTSEGATTTQKIPRRLSSR